MVRRTDWAAPLYSRGQVDKAGTLLANGGIRSDTEEGIRLLRVFSNWRSSHSFPLNTLQMGLRNRSRSIDDASIVAQRLKRVPSIIHKMQRFPKMKLSRIQDIGGARAVVSTVRDVDGLRTLYRHSRARHKLANEKDYIRNPKDSGYRGIHLVYRYYSERSNAYNGLQIELQLRTRTQHAWATAVETVGTFLGQSLKASQGQKNWLRFFELVGSGFAMADGAPTAHNVPSDPGNLVRQIGAAAKKLRVKDRLGAFHRALKVAGDEDFRGYKYFLLRLRPDEGSLEMTAYREGQLATATEAYLEAERQLANTSGDAVLVASDSLETLRRAFPNYFADTQIFVREMDQLLS